MSADLPDREKLADDLRQVILPLGAALSAEPDLDRLLERIVVEAKALCHADAGTLYLRTEDDRLEFSILRTDSLGLALGGTTGREIPFAPLRLYQEDGEPNVHNVCTQVALSGRRVNIPDVHAADGFDFSGTKAFDERNAYRSVSCLTVPLTSHAGRVIGVLQLINARDPAGGRVVPFDAYAEEVVECLASQAAVALRNKILTDTEARLGRELRAKHEELQGAYLRIEAAKADLETALKKVQLVRAAATAGVFLFFLGVGAFTWLRAPSRDRAAVSAPGGGGPERTLRVTPRPVVATVWVSGPIEPLEMVTVVAPFDGKLKERLFQYGQRVEQGQVLLRMDATDLEVRYRNARAAAIKAAKRLHDLRDWDKGSDVAQARRALSKAKLALEMQQKELDETIRLYAKGIVATAELEAARQQLQSQQMDYQTAQEALQSTLEAGGPEALQVAEYELANASTQARDLEDKLGRAAVAAPVGGVVFPSGARGGEPRSVDRGTPVAQGEAILAVGNLEGLSIRSAVDQVDVARVSVGQKVRVSGDAFRGRTLAGAVSYVSSEGRPNAGVPFFPVVASVGHLAEDERRVFRLGMTADVEIVVYEKADALVVPMAAVRSGPEGRSVRVVDPATRRPRDVKVETGVSTLDGIEITSGLRAGDEVLVSEER